MTWSDPPSFSKPDISKPDISRPTVIKLGGAALRDPKMIEIIGKQLASAHAAGASLVLVHGGGPAINDELTSKGITWEFVRGQRVTTDAMMDVIEMVLCGKVNKTLVRALNFSDSKTHSQTHSHIQSHAVGLSGTDARMLLCEPLSVEMGRVGEVKKVNTAPIEALLQAGLLPVISPIGITSDGKAMNINADWAACRIAEALGAQKLTFITDQDGILDGDKKLISKMDAADLESLASSGVVQGGMLTKTQAILHALYNGVSEVHVMNGNHFSAMAHSRSIQDQFIPDQLPDQLSEQFVSDQLPDQLPEMKGTLCHA